VNDDVISLKDYLLILRRQRWVVIGTMVVVVLAALAWSFAQTPEYEAQTEVSLERVRSAADMSLEDLFAPGTALTETEQIVMTSRPVAERAAQRLGLDGPNQALAGVRIETVGSTTVLRVIATDADPDIAAARANAFADSYLEFRKAQAVEETIDARTILAQRADLLQEEIQTLEDEIDEASDEEVEALQVRRDALLTQLEQISLQMTALGTSPDDITGGGVVLTPAEAPERPVSPNPLRAGVLAAGLGLLLGIGLALLRDYLDDVIRDEADFKRATSGRPTLGRIPHQQVADGDALVTISEPSSLAAESYRELSAGVRFLLVTHGGAAPAQTVHSLGDADGAPTHGRSIMVASANAGEGKTSTSANLAVAAARVGLRTVLVDVDLRRSMIHRRFGMGRTAGLSDVLLGAGNVHDHLVDVGVTNLRVLPAGTVPPNPAELLASAAMRALQHELLEQADLVIYDTPAVLAVPDSLEIGRFVDLAILVGRVGQSSRRQLGAAIERLEQVGTDFAGTVLNDVDVRSDGYSYTHYFDQAATGSAEAADGASPARTRRRPSRTKKTADSAASTFGQPTEAPPATSTSGVSLVSVRTLPRRLGSSNPHEGDDGAARSVHSRRPEAGHPDAAVADHPAGVDEPGHGPLR
jgi:polysaccharide biosynthesis transport protein